MTVDAMYLRSAQEHGQSKRVVETATKNIDRARRAAEDIRRMTRIYLEREKGRRVDQ